MDFAALGNMKNIKKISNARRLHIIRISIAPFAGKCTACLTKS
jgi:hypothetical protein